jgi:hypothetical protein
MCKTQTGMRLGKFPMVRRTLFCRCCNFSRWLSATNSQVGQVQVITVLTTALWRVNLMLLLNCSFLNRDMGVLCVSAFISLLQVCVLLYDMKFV